MSQYKITHPLGLKCLTREVQDALKAKPRNDRRNINRLVSSLGHSILTLEKITDKSSERYKLKKGQATSLIYALNCAAQVKNVKVNTSIIEEVLRASSESLADNV
jgi:hypothetical protein